MPAQPTTEAEDVMAAPETDDPGPISFTFQYRTIGEPRLMETITISSDDQLALSQVLADNQAGQLLAKRLCQYGYRIDAKLFDAGPDGMRRVHETLELPDELKKLLYPEPCPEWLDMEAAWPEIRRRLVTLRTITEFRRFTGAEWPPYTGGLVEATRQQVMDEHGVDPVTGDICGRAPRPYGTSLRAAAEALLLTDPARIALEAAGGITFPGPDGKSIPLREFPEWQALLDAIAKNRRQQRPAGIGSELGPPA